MKGKHIREKEFDMIKSLQNYGVKANQVAKMTDRGRATIYRVYKAKDYKALQEARDQHTQYQKARRHAKTFLEPATAIISGQTVPETDPKLVELHMRFDEIFNRLDQIAAAVNALLEAEADKQVTAKTNRWKFGG